MPKTLIKNVLVYDGTGNFPFFSDVLLEDIKTSKTKKEIDVHAHEVIDGGNMALSPGFINVHSHSDLIALTLKD